MLARIGQPIGRAKNSHEASVTSSCARSDASPSGFRPLPSVFGHASVLESPLLFQAVETPSGSVDRGEAFVVFERDGTASPTEIVLSDGDGHALALEVLTLAEAVRIRDVEI